MTKDVVHYLVKWKGYDAVEASWKAVEELDHARELIADYEAVRQQADVEDGVADESVELAVMWSVTPRLTVDSGGRRGRPGVRCLYSVLVDKAAGSDV